MTPKAEQLVRRVRLLTGKANISIHRYFVLLFRYSWRMISFSENK